MTTVAIMQPTYLPWCGYMAMLDQADVFILDDLAAVNLKSWQMRNRIRARDGNVIWLSVPTNAKRGMPLNQVKVIDNGWQRKHWRSIEHAYSHTPGWEMVMNGVNLSAAVPELRLTTMSGYLIKSLGHVLGISTQIIRASDLGPTRPGMADRITDLCHAVDADVLLNTRTAAAYLDETMLDHIQIQWHDYQPQPYQQGQMEWQSHLSVVDLIAHTADNALNVIRGNPTGNLHSDT